jgi:hypothetical protein
MKKDYIVDKEMLLDFLSNFKVYRAGNYDVPTVLLAAAVEEYLENGTVNCLTEYEDEVFGKGIY